MCVYTYTYIYRKFELIIKEGTHYPSVNIDSLMKKSTLISSFTFVISWNGKSTVNVHSTYHSHSLSVPTVSLGCLIGCRHFRLYQILFIYCQSPDTLLRI